MIKELLFYDKLIDAQNNKGDTSLHIATSKSYITIVDILLNAKAKTDIKNRKGRTAFDVIKNPDILELFKHHQNIVVNPQENETNYYKEESKINEIYGQTTDSVPSTSKSKEFYEEIKTPQISDQSKLQRTEPQSDEIKGLKYSKRSGTSGISGQLYETKLLVKILQRALNDRKIEEFHLGTNVEDLGAFDDIVLKYKIIDEEKPKFLFVQSKHRDDPSKGRITIGDLRKGSGDFSLHKYFDSYLRVKQKFTSKIKYDRDIFDGDFKEMDLDFIIYTCAVESFDEDQKIGISQNYLLNSDEAGKAFRLNYEEEDVNCLVKTSWFWNSRLLADKLAYFITNNQFQNMMSDSHMKTYHVFLAQNILEVSDIKLGDQREGKFRNDFLYDKKYTYFRKLLYNKLVRSESSFQLKELECLLKEILENPSSEAISKIMGSQLEFDPEKCRLKFIEKNFPKEIICLINKIKLNEETIDEIIANKLKPVRIKLPTSFGNLDFKINDNETKRNKRMEHLISKLSTLIDNAQFTDNVIKIDNSMVGPGKEKLLKDGDLGINGGFGGLIGNLLLVTDNDMFKINDDKESLPHNAKLFLEKLKSVFPKDVLEKIRFEFNIQDFPQLSLADKSMVKEFLDKLLFYTNQPNEEAIEKIIKEEINKYCLKIHPNKEFSFDIRTDAIFLEVHDKVQTWWKKQDEACYLTQNCCYFDNAEEKIIKNPILTILKIIFIGNIKKTDIEFKQTAVDRLGVDDFVKKSDKQILNIITKEQQLTAIKLIQSLPNFDVLDLYYLYLNKYKATEAMAELNRSENLLIIYYSNANSYTTEIFNGLSELIKNNEKKKIILINQKTDHLVEKIIKIKDIIRLVEDEHNNLMDLTEDSQKSILSKQVLFQGEEVPLFHIVENSKHLIDEEVLSRIIKDKTMKIGKSLMDHKYHQTKIYYVDRSVGILKTIRKNLPSDTFDVFFAKAYSKNDKIPVKDNLNIVIISNDEHQFMKLSEDYDFCNIHWLRDNPAGYIWQRTHGDIMKLLKFVDTDEKVTIELKTTTDVSDKVVIVSAEPGMGKSTMLTHLAVETKKYDAALWILKINLIHYQTQLEKCQKRFNKKEAIAFLHSSDGFNLGEETEKEPNLNNFRVKLFLDFLDKGRVILMFDGFDEICPYYKDKVVELLQTLKQSNLSNIWITTRPYNDIKRTLQNKLGSISYSLNPFSNKQTIDFFNKIWNAENKIDIKRSTNIINNFVKNFNHSVYNKNFLKTPLHALMIAEELKENFQKCCYNDDEQMPKIGGFDLISLYENIIKTKYYKIENEEKRGINNTDSRVKSIFENTYKKFVDDHQNLAVIALFKKDEVKELLPKEVIDEAEAAMENISEAEEKTGLIDSIKGNKPNFIHQTFAEYFVAGFMWEKFETTPIDAFENDFIKNTLIRHLIKRDRFEICNFLQLKASKNLIDRDKIIILFRNLFNMLEKSSNESIELLFGIINNYLPIKNLEDFENCENYKKLYDLICISAKMNYMNFIEILGDKFNKKTMRICVKVKHLDNSPFWLAAKNNNLEMLQILIDKYAFKNTWTDKHGKQLIEVIFNRQAIDVLKIFLEMNIIDGAPYICKHKIKLPLIKSIESRVSSDIVKRIIEKTDTNLLDKIALNDKFSGLKAVIKNLLKYDKDIIEFCGVNFPQIINLFLNDSIIKTLKDLQPEYPLHLEFLEEENIKFSEVSKNFVLFLKCGIGYNRKNDDNKTTMQIMKEFYTCYKLFESVLNSNDTKPGLILSIVLLCYIKKDPDFKKLTVEIKKKDVYLLIHFQKKTTRISLIPEFCVELIIQSYKNRNVNLLQKSVDNVHSFVKYNKYKLLQIKYARSIENVLDSIECSPVRKKSRKKMKSLNDYEESLVTWMIEFFLSKVWTFDEALEEISQYVLKIKDVMNMLNERDEFNIYDILDAFFINNIEENEQIKDFIAQNDCESFDFLIETFSYMNYIGKKVKKEEIRLLKILEFIEELYNIMTELDSSYHDLLVSIKNKEYDKMQEILQNKSDFAKSIINGQDDEHGSPLHYAAYSGDTKSAEIILKFKANPNARLTTFGQILVANSNKKQDLINLKLDGFVTWMPLHLAAFYGHKEVAEMLIKNGAWINAEIHGKFTPLDLGLSRKHSEVVECLLNKGAKQC